MAQCVTVNGFTQFCTLFLSEEDGEHNFRGRWK